VVQCDSHVEVSADTVLPPTGGTISVGDATLEVPPGAVKGRTRFHLVVPSGKRFLVRATARDFQGAPIDEFNEPLRLTLNYGPRHCQRDTTAATPKKYFSIWEVDAAGKPAVPAGGADDTQRSRIQVLLSHFTGFILAQG
jgi:hypothetical protein